VAGDPNVVDTSSGDAAAGDIASGKKAWVDGSEITGTASGGGSSAAVPQTGQGDCYKDDGTAGTCTCGTANCPSKQDGDLKKGVAWPNPRFTDNGDGTVTDNLTGLIWLKDANAANTTAYDTDGKITWAQAFDFVSKLNNGDYGAGSSGNCGQTDLRLPNRFEMESLLHLGYSSPAVPNRAGTGQWAAGDPFNNLKFGAADRYWTSTTSAASTTYAWIVNLNDGYVLNGGKAGTYYVLPVRGGH
jgi:hypothetical protein